MIREGGFTTGTSDVLAGTQFSQITSTMHLTVRARYIQSGDFSASRRYEFSAGAIVLATGIANQQNLSLGGASGTDERPSQDVGLGGADVIYSGPVNPATLNLSFADGANTVGIIWDVTAA